MVARRSAAYLYVLRACQRGQLVMCKRLGSIIAPSRCTRASASLGAISGNGALIAKQHQAACVSVGSACYGGHQQAKALATKLA